MIGVKRNILFFNQSRDIGGTDTFIVSLIKYWPGEKDGLTVWCNQAHKGLGLYQDLPVSFEKIKFPTLVEIYGFIDKYKAHRLVSKFYKAVVFLIVKPILFTISVLFFYRKLKKEKFDIIFSNNGGYPGGELCQSLIIAAGLANVNKKFLIINSDAYKDIFPFRVWEYFFIDRLVSNTCSEIISVSDSCIRQLKGSCNFSRSIKLIYYGIPIERKDSLSIKEKREKLGMAVNGRAIGCIGNYEERKGHKYLIQAFIKIRDAFPNAKLFIIGSKDFSEAERLEKIISELDLKNEVYLTGFLPNASEYIECFDIVVQPSIADESFGIVLLEAMLYKRPVIGTSIGGIPEAIGDAGFIVEPYNIDMLAEKIIFLLRNPEIAKTVGEKGYERLKEKFSIDKMVRKYYELSL